MLSDPTVIFFPCHVPQCKHNVRQSQSVTEAVQVEQGGPEAVTEEV